MLPTIVVIFLCLVSPGHSQSTSPHKPLRSNGNSQETGVIPTDIPIEVNADRLSFNKETNTYTVRGNVTLRQGNTKLRADTVSYNADSGELTAKGGVIVRIGGDVVEAEEFTLRLRDSTGVLYNGKLLLTRNNIYLEGEKLEKVGDSTYRIHKGSFTTCDGATPDWRITGRDLDVTLEGYGTLKHGLFYIKDIPVFYIPWLIYPAKRTRQSGFLMPTFANSSLRGFDIRFPFFLNINPSMDATLVPRICSKRAAQASLEFRYTPYEYLKGRFYGEYTYDWKYGPETDPESHRFYVTLRHDQEIAQWLRLKVNGSWVSDRNYFEFWGGRFDRRLRVRYLESNAVLYRQTNNFLFQAEARHFDNLDLPDNALTVQNLPIITGTLFSSQIPFTPFYVSSNVIYDHFYSPVLHERWLGSRVQADTRLSFPISLGRYLKLEPSMTYFAKAYLADYFVKDKSASSVSTIRTDLYQINADLFTDLNTVYWGSFLGFQRIKHTLRPRFAWTYRPFTKSQTYPYFDEHDRMDRTSLLTAEMRQTLTGRLGQGEYLDFVTFIISQGYDFAKPTNDEEPLAPEEFSVSRLTTTQAELTIRPHTLLDLTAQAEYDPVMDRALRYSVQLGLMDHRGDTMRVLHQFNEDERKTNLNRQTNVSLQMKLTSDLDCFAETQYTHQFDFSYFTSFGVNYHPRCWSILLRYSEVREQDPLTHKIKDPDQTVFATLSLYGLGQIYRFTRDWGELLGDLGESRSPVSR